MTHAQLKARLTHPKNKGRYLEAWVERGGKMHKMGLNRLAVLKHISRVDDPETMTAIKAVQPCTFMEYISIKTGFQY